MAIRTNGRFQTSGKEGGQEGQLKGSHSGVSGAVKINQVGGGNKPNGRRDGEEILREKGWRRDTKRFCMGQ